MDIKISFDKTAFQCKPTNRQTAFMKKRLPKEEDYYDIKTIAERIGNHGHSFLPATFEGLASKQENFEQCQLFAIDFDDEPDYEWNIIFLSFSLIIHSVLLQNIQSIGLSYVISFQLQKNG